MKVVVLHSGGIDSTVLVYDLLAQGHQVVSFGVDYGQRHREPEMAAAHAIAQRLGISRCRYVTGAIKASALTDGAGGVVVPNRNMIMISVAASWAAGPEKADAVAVACHRDDYELFPDCRPEFLEATARALEAGSGLRLMYPYVWSSKEDIVRRGRELGVPFEMTWSCYGPGPEPCASCLACEERRRALAVILQGRELALYEGEEAFSLDQVENPHPRMLCGALLARAGGGDYWAGYMAAMVDATGCPEGDLEAWMDRRLQQR